MLDAWTCITDPTNLTKHKTPQCDRLFDKPIALRVYDDLRVCLIRACQALKSGLLLRGPTPDDSIGPRRAGRPGG